MDLIVLLGIFYLLHGHLYHLGSGLCLYGLGLDPWERKSIKLDVKSLAAVPGERNSLELNSKSRPTRCLLTLTDQSKLTLVDRTKLVLLFQ